GACQSQRAMPPYCRGSKHQKNGLAPLEERKRLCDPPNLPNLISFICLFPINMQPLALFLRKEPGGLSSISGCACTPFSLRKSEGQFFRTDARPSCGSKPPPPPRGDRICRGPAGCGVFQRGSASVRILRHCPWWTRGCPAVSGR